MVVVDMDHTRVQVFIKIILYRESLAVGHLEGGVVSCQSSWGQWVDGYYCLEGTPVGRAGEDLQCVGVDVHHCLVVGTPQPMEGEVVTSCQTGQSQIIM